MKNVITERVKLYSLAFVLLALFAVTPTYGQDIPLSKKDYLLLIVGNYVHGYKEFDTSVVSFDDSVSIGIYFDSSTQSEDRANALAARFREQIEYRLREQDWAQEVKVIVNVYSESRTERGY